MKDLHLGFAALSVHDETHGSMACAGKVQVFEVICMGIDLNKHAVYEKTPDGDLQENRGATRSAAIRDELRAGEQSPGAKWVTYAHGCPQKETKILRYANGDLHCYVCWFRGNDGKGDTP